MNEYQSDPQIKYFYYRDRKYGFPDLDKFSGRDRKGWKKAHLKQFLNMLHLDEIDSYHTIEIIKSLHFDFNEYSDECIGTSLEIFRKRNEDMSIVDAYFDALTENEKLNVVSVEMERALFYISRGELAEAFQLLHEKMTIDGFEYDVNVIATLGVLAYWLLLYTNRPLLDRLSSDQTVLMTGGSYQSYNYYQFATTYLGKLISLVPENGQFLEYYAQLLVLGNEVEKACDYLESFYHKNKNDVQAHRMLALFLERYYPDSNDAQMDILEGWIQLDPHAWYAILRYTALFEEYYTTNPLRVTSFVEMVLNVIEYICPEDNDIAKSLYLWKKLDANFGMYKSCTTYDVLENRKWWCDYFFQVPNTMKQDELELCAYKATILKELCMKQYKSFIYVAMQNLNAVTDAKDLYDPIYQLYVQHGMMHDQVDSPLIATNQVMKNKIMRVPRILERKKVFQSEIYAARITEIPHEENMVSYLETELTQSEIATVINGLN